MAAARRRGRICVVAVVVIKQAAGGFGKVLGAGGAACGGIGFVRRLGSSQGLGVKLCREIRHIIVQNGRCRAAADGMAAGAGQLGFGGGKRFTVHFGGRGTAVHPQTAGGTGGFWAGGTDVQRVGSVCSRGGGCLVFLVQFRFKANRAGGFGYRRGRSMGAAHIQVAGRAGVSGFRRGRFRRRRGHRLGGVKVQHRLKVCRAVRLGGGRCAAAQREPHRVAPLTPGLGHDQQRPLPPRAEDDAGIGQPQAQHAAAQQVQDLVADGGIVQVRRQRAGGSTVVIADQHKGALAHGSGHVHGGKVRPCGLHGGQGAACGGLHHIAGEFFQQLGRHRDLLLLFGVSVALGAKVKHSFAVGQRLQQRTNQTARSFIRRHQQLALFQQGVQRSLGQAGLAGGKHIIAKFGAQALHPFFAVLLGHGAVGRTDLHADGKLAITFQQAQAGAAIGSCLTQHRRNFRRRGAEDAQNSQFCVYHVEPLVKYPLLWPGYPG